MKKEFSKQWKGSSQPRKQRKYLANAPIHIKRKFLSINLSKDLRKKQETRNIEVRVGDKVKVMRGKFKKKEGKVTKILTKLGKIYIERIQIDKKDGSKVDVPFRASNLQIIELNMDDKKRFSNNKETSKKAEKPVVKENKK
jgi:large subunit ribosomal protein L24